MIEKLKEIAEHVFGQDYELTVKYDSASEIFTISMSGCGCLIKQRFSSLALDDPRSAIWECIEEDYKRQFGAFVAYLKNERTSPTPQETIS
jgi:hypothetical protein